MIPYGRQNITQSDVDAVVETLKSDYLTQGPKVPAFEESVRQFVGSGYAVAGNSATSMLHVACMALGLGENGLLWTSPNTFVASANCALYCGASIDFVDINPDTYNIDIDSLTLKLELADKEGTLPNVLVVVHFGGQSCDMQKIACLSKRYKFKVIEDASHCIGGHYEENPIGNCKYSDISIFSFHPVKIITTMEGGMATTNDESLFHKMQRYRSHGVTREEEFLENCNGFAWYYEQLELGFNYRMTDVQAALGSSQMFTLEDNIERRRYLAARYHQLLSDLPISHQKADELSNSSWHLYVLRLLNVESLEQKSFIFDRLRERGIGVNVHYIPVHTQPYYKSLGFDWGMFPEAENYYRQALSIPLYPQLGESEQDYIVNELRKVV